VKRLEDTLSTDSKENRREAERERRGGREAGREREREKRDRYIYAIADRYIHIYI